MTFEQLASERYSVRKFKNQHLEQEIIDKILSVGHFAPTGCNYQPQRILVMNTDESISKLRACSISHYNAPTAMLICYNKDECWTRKYDGKNCGVSDACIVTTHLMLAAWELGVGTTWVMNFDPFAMREAFSIPENVIPVALLIMGYPADDATPLNLHSEFRPMDEVVKYDTF